MALQVFLKSKVIPNLTAPLIVLLDGIAKQALRDEICFPKKGGGDRLFGK